MKSILRPHKTIVGKRCNEYNLLSLSLRGVIKRDMDNPEGKYLLATGTHVVTVIDGDYYDTWDSGDEIPIYYFTKEE